VCTPVQVKSQDAPSLGLKAGINMSGFDDEKSKSLLGFVGGAFLTYGLTDWLTIQPELLLSGKGGTLVDEAQGYNPVEFNFRLTYVEIPLLTKLHVVRSSQFRPSAIVGPFVSYYTQNLRQIDFGVVFGAAFSLEFEASSLIFDVRYTLGLRKVASILTTLTDVLGNVVYQNNREVKTKALSVTLGYAFQ
jgi:hypothetical protein